MSLYYIQILNIITNTNGDLRISIIFLGILLEGILGMIIASTCYKKKLESFHSK